MTATGTEVETLTFAEAIRAALSQEMEADQRVFVLGEDIGVYGGAFGVTTGMLERFGAERIRDTPIAEEAIVGAAVGAALCGMRPVAEMQFSDFTAHAMDQLVNQAAKVHFMLGGAVSVPLVLRLPFGSGTGAAAQHSQSQEAWYAHTPGLKVVMPSNPADAKGLLLAAIRDPNPVVFMEHKLLYRTASGPVPAGGDPIPLGMATVAREGGDLTIVATGIMVSRALAAAEELAGSGIEATILERVGATGRALLVQEAPRTAGFTAEISARIAESDTLYHLLAPVRRLSGLDAPIPYNPELEKASVPQVPDIVRAARALLEDG
jgi:pyruvate/2-oxoglutarate/acetoin dehydrogenase E1 component